MPRTNAVKPSPARWAYLKALRPRPPRMVHVSAHILHVPDPDNPHVVTPKAARGNTYKKAEDTPGEVA